jgi:hypothetical protein
MRSFGTIDHVCIQALSLRDILKSMQLSDASSNPYSKATSLPAVMIGGAVLVTGTLIGIAGPLAVVLFLGVMLSLVALLDFRIGVAVMIVALPFASTHYFPHQMFGITGANPLNLLVLATLLALVIRHRQNDRTIAAVMPKELLFLLLPWFVGGIIGAQHVHEIPAFLFVKKLSFDTSGGYLRDILLRQMLPVVLGVLVALAVVRSKRAEWLFIPFSIAAIVLALVVAAILLQSGLSLGAMSGENARGLMSFTGMHANELGFLFGTSFALHLFVLPAPQGSLQRSLTIAGLVCSAMIVALSFSRAAIGAAALVTVYFMVSRRQVTALIIGVLALACVLILLPNAFWNRLGTGVAGGVDSASLTAGRLNLIWLPLIKTIPDHLFMGNGLHSVLWSPPQISRVMLPVEHAHSAYLNTILDFGILGSISIFLFYRFLFRETARLARQDANPYFKHFHLGLKVALILLFLQGITDERFVPTRGQVFLWFGVGVLLGRRAIACDRDSMRPCSVVSRLTPICDSGP